MGRVGRTELDFKVGALDGRAVRVVVVGFVALLVQVVDLGSSEKIAVSRRGLGCAHGRSLSTLDRRHVSHVLPVHSLKRRWHCRTWTLSRNRAGLA